MRTLEVEEARAFYDRFGSKQDRQSFYEAPALETLVARCALAQAHAVFELGCGTGRLAEMLLREHLPADACYLGVDISSTMITLASQRLAPFASRARVRQVEGEPRFPLEDASVDRVISTYVLDLMPEPAIRQALCEARRVLAPGGLLCLAGITNGTSAASRAVMGAWQWLFARKPSWLGGCRPLALEGFLSNGWEIRFLRTIVACGIASEVVIASPKPDTPAR